MTDEQRRTGPRQVYRRGDGTYHVESEPGAGPEHHDDLPLTPDDLERKDAGEPSTLDLSELDTADLQAELDRRAGGGTVTPVPGGGIGPSEEHQRIINLGAMAEEMRSKVYIVAGPRGQLQGLYVGDGPQAHVHARALGGVVVELPIAGDYR